MFVKFVGGTRKRPVDRRLLSPLYNAVSSLSATVTVIGSEADDSDEKVIFNLEHYKTIMAWTSLQSKHLLSLNHISTVF